MELQESRYNKLRDDILAKNIFTGQTCEDIRALYEEPQDIYRSTSSVSSLEIWTYDLPSPTKDFFVRPIRLYFNDCKLSSWSG
ncbi:hypothetical protein ACFL1E_06555 [Candidatus Omnitrophota bacterium]